MLTIDDRGGVRVIRMAHGKVSAMDVALCDAVAEQLGAARDTSVRAVVITGTGSSFSAGVDLFQVLDGGAPYVDRFLPVFERLLREVVTFPKPVVAAVNGHAIAGGCILAAACDRCIMADGNGRLGIPELLVGVPFPVLALEIMAARVPPASLRELVFSGRTLPVSDAVAAGLVDETCPADRLIDHACEIAERMATIPAGAFALTKETMWRPLLERVRQLSSLDERIAHEWTNPATYDAIRRYLETTLGRKWSDGSPPSRGPSARGPGRHV